MFSKNCHFNVRKFGHFEKKIFKKKKIVVLVGYEGSTENFSNLEKYVLSKELKQMCESNYLYL